MAINYDELENRTREAEAAKNLNCRIETEEEMRPDGLRIWQVKEEKEILEAILKEAFVRFTTKTGFAVTYVDIDGDPEDYPKPSYRDVKVTIQL